MAHRQASTFTIKVSGVHYDQIVDGTRSFVLLADDRPAGYQVGDLLNIQKLSRPGKPFLRYIQSIQKSGKGLMQGHIILGLVE